MTIEEIQARLAEPKGGAALGTAYGWKAFREIRRSGNGYQIKIGRQRDWSFIFDLSNVRLGYWNR